MDYKDARDDCYTARGALSYCPDDIKSDPLIQAALMQIDIAEAAIAARATQIENKRPDED